MFSEGAWTVTTDTVYHAVITQLRSSYSLLVVLFVLVTVRSAPVTAHAEVPGAAAEATQRAIANRVNDCAQRTVDCSTPTPTLAPTSQPQPTQTATPTLTPTAAPTATPEPEPCWLTDDSGAIVFDEDGAPVPCPEPPQDLAQAEDPAPEPTEAPLASPTVSAPAPNAAQALPASPPRPTNLPTATIAPLPTYTPYPTYTPQPTYTPVATVTPMATRTPTVTATVKTTPTPAAPYNRCGVEIVCTVASPVPLGEAAPPAVRTALNIPTLAVLEVLGGIGLLFAVVWGVVIFKRRRLVRKPRPPREDAYA